MGIWKQFLIECVACDDGPTLLRSNEKTVAKARKVAEESGWASFKFQEHVLDICPDCITAMVLKSET